MIGFIIWTTVGIGGFTALSHLARWWQKRRDAVQAFAVAAEKLKRPNEMPRSTPLLRTTPLQVRRHPQGRHSK